jgi:hypothetical protein
MKDVGKKQATIFKRTIPTIGALSNLSALR